METINVSEKTKKMFEEERMITIGKEARAINQNEFVELLIKNWRTK